MTAVPLVVQYVIDRPLGYLQSPLCGCSFHSVFFLYLQPAPAWPSGLARFGLCNYFEGLPAHLFHHLAFFFSLRGHR